MCWYRWLIGPVLPVEASGCISRGQHQSLFVGELHPMGISFVAGGDALLVCFTAILFGLHCGNQDQ